MGSMATQDKVLNFVFNWVANFHVSIEYLISGQYYKTFIGVIYTTSGAFPYDFDWDYDNSNAIMSKKVL